MKRWLSERSCSWPHPLPRPSTLRRVPRRRRCRGGPVNETAAATWAAGMQRAPNFTLRDQHGAPVSLAAFRGRPVIVAFIDPLCRDYCPLEAQHLNDVVRALPAGEKPAIVAVSANIYGNARRTCCWTSESGSSFRSGAGRSARRPLSAGSGARTTSRCSRRRRRSPASRCTQSAIQKPRM